MKKNSSKKEQRKQLLEEIRPLLPANDQTKLSEDELIIHLCQSFKQAHLLSDDQSKRLSKLGQKLGRTPQSIASTYIDYGIKTLEKKFQNLEKKVKKTKKSDYKLLNIAGSAQMRIKDVVTKLMKKNNKAKSPDDKVFISQTIIAQHTGCNRPAIRSWTEVHEKMLKEHHQKHKLDENHNRRFTLKKKRLDRIQAGLTNTLKI